MTEKKDEIKAADTTPETKQPWKNKHSEPLEIPKKNIDKRKELFGKMKGMKPKT